MSTSADGPAARELHVGVDFDNTLVCYDALFVRAAVERGWDIDDATDDKTGVRDRLRALGREDDWTELQGEVYGPRILEAPAFPGALDFFARMAELGATVSIVSHKTATPARGPRHDLRAGARRWLESQGFADVDGFDWGRVYFENTRADKAARIGTLGCTHFIDDLPEFLVTPGLPADLVRILFDPARRHGASVDGSVRKLAAWADASTLVLS